MTISAQELLATHGPHLQTLLHETKLQASKLPLALNLATPERQEYLLTNNDVSLYIHYPFCVHKCPYCDFASLAEGSDRQRDEQYINLLIKEFKLKAPLLGTRKLISLYIGGGTPSLCEPDLWGRLLETVGPYLAPGAEMSLEANPGTIDLQRLKELRAVGFNRISIGVQSFNDQALKRLGRIHNGQEAINACTNARKAGFENYNLDIMHGLPRQDVGLALSDLHMALQMQSTHLSWYELTLEEGTVFGDHPPALPDEDVLYSIEQEGFYLLDKAGFEHYEVSGYNLGGDYRCLHNQNYWLYGDYLGIGAAAHQKITLRSAADSALDSATPVITKEAISSLASVSAISYVPALDKGAALGIYRSANSENYLEYMNACMQSHANLAQGVLEQRLVPSDERAFEFMLNRLRLGYDKVRAGEFEMRTGLDQSTIVSELKHIQEQGLIELYADGSFALNDQGRLMLNDALAYFL